MKKKTTTKISLTCFEDIKNKWQRNDSTFSNDRVRDVHESDSPKLLFRVAISLTRMGEHGSDSLMALCLVGNNTFFIVQKKIVRFQISNAILYIYNIQIFVNFAARYRSSVSNLVFMCIYLLAK